MKKTCSIMKALLLISVSLLPFELKAADRSGADCGLTDFRNVDEWISLGEQQILTQMTDQELSRLATLTKQQLIITAKEETKARDTNPAVIKNVVQAVKYLRENSESEDVHVTLYKVNKLVVTEIAFWPGGNPYSYVFLRGTTRLIALNQDDEVSCR